MGLKKFSLQTTLIGVGGVQFLIPAAVGEGVQSLIAADWDEGVPSLIAVDGGGGVQSQIGVEGSSPKGRGVQS
jgi:hypothetical protein